MARKHGLERIKRLAQGLRPNPSEPVQGTVGGVTPPRHIGDFGAGPRRNIFNIWSSERTSVDTYPAGK